MAITVTRDPNYRDPNFDRDFSAAEGTVEALDMFNAPPAGHSLTDTPQEWSWKDLLKYLNQKMQYVL